MRIIDEKGKIFGKINIIDFLVILFFFCIMPIFYFGYKILILEDKIPKEFVEIETSCLLIKLEPEIAELISIGDKEFYENGELLGEIIELDQSEPYRYIFNLGANQIIIKDDPRLKQIKAKLKLKALVKENKPYYKDREIRVGLPLELETEKYSIEIVPTEAEEEEIEEKKIILSMKFISIFPEIAEVIKVGDERIEFEKEDNNGKKEVARVVARIEKIISNEQSEFISLSDRDKKWYITKHPKNRDLVLEIMVLCQVRKDDLFLFNDESIQSGLFSFNDESIKIGLFYNFYTDSYSIDGMIIGMREE